MEEKGPKYYKSKIESQGRTQVWVANEMGISKELLCMKLNQTGKARLRDYEKQQLDKILGL